MRILISGGIAGLTLAYWLQRQEGFLRYEQRMRPHVQAQQRHAHSLAKSFAPTSRVGVLTQRLLLKVVLRDAFTGLLRQQSGAESILHTP